MDSLTLFKTQIGIILTFLVVQAENKELKEKLAALGQKSDSGTEINKLIPFCLSTAMLG